MSHWLRPHRGSLFSYYAAIWRGRGLLNLGPSKKEDPMHTAPIDILRAKPCLNTLLNSFVGIFFVVHALYFFALSLWSVSVHGQY